MDAVDIPTLVGTGGVFVALAVVLVTLLRQNSADRGDYQQIRAALQAQIDAERQRADFERQLRQSKEDEADKKIDALQEEIRTLRAQLSQQASQIEDLQHHIGARPL